MIRETTPASDTIVNLDGPHGNAFYLMSLAKDLAHFEDKRVTPIISEMCGGSDYYQLVQIFNKHFGHRVILETNQTDWLEFVNAD